MYHNSKLSKFAFHTKMGLKWSFFAQTITFFGFCFITNIYIWYIVGSVILRSARLKYFLIYQICVTFLIIHFVYFSCQGRSFMLTAKSKLSWRRYCISCHFCTKIALLYAFWVHFLYYCCKKSTFYPYRNNLLHTF